MSSADYKKEFKAKLRKHWVPLLKEDGFGGKPFRFVRHESPTLFVVDLQLESTGGRYAVNIGFQLDFLELFSGKPVGDIHKLRVADCIGKRRLAHAGETAAWWDIENPTSVEDLIECYRSQGRQFIAKYSDYPSPFVDAARDTSQLKTISDELFEPVASIALIAAKVSLREGNRTEALILAEYGLENAPPKAQWLIDSLKSVGS